MSGTQARTQDFLKGGGEGRHSQAHTRSVTFGYFRGNVYFSLVQKLLDIARVTSSTFRGGGGGDRSRPRTLCIGFQHRDKFGGGGWSSLSPPSWIRHWNTIYRVWLGCLYHGRNKESSSNRRGWLISHSGAYFHL